MAKVSVIIPVYKVEKYLRQCLDSVVLQTLRDIEIIVIDDGSPDKCGQIIDEYATRDSRIIAIHKSNAGVSAARNDGIKISSGEYLYIMDSDDWIEKQTLESLYQKAISDKSDVVYFDWIREWPSGPQMVKSFPNAFCSDSAETIKAIQLAVMAGSSFPLKISRPEFSYIIQVGGAPWRCLIRKTIIHDNDLCFDPYVRGLGDDILFMLDVFEYVNRVSYIQEFYYHWRIVDSSYTHSFRPELISTYARIYERMERFIDKHHKQDKFKSFYYIRVLIYLNSSMKRYFKNASNSKPVSERVDEFSELLKKEPYKTAIKKVPLQIIGSKRVVTFGLLLRLKLFRWYWKMT